MSQHITYIDIFVVSCLVLAWLFLVVAPERKEDEQTYGGMAHLMKMGSYTLGLYLIGFFTLETLHSYKPTCTEQEESDKMSLCSPKPTVRNLTKEEYAARMRELGIESHE